MLLIGIAGTVGSGKTTLLCTLVDWWRGTGKMADGFVARAGKRNPVTLAAERYDILMLSSSRAYPFACRDESSSPPYRFDPEAATALGEWAGSLSRGESPSLIILDEFGPIEAAGGGHVLLWDGIMSSHPEIVVIAVRKGLESEIKSRLGRQFDLLINVESPDAWHTLQQACTAHSDWARIGVYGGGAGGFEASVGAILHGTQIPLRGLFLSSMQSVIMTYAAQGLRQRRRIVWVSFLAASLKALSPTGGRLRPMMAIALQGILYTLAITLLGWNVLGVMLAGFLVGVWATLQGVALQYLFIGKELIQAYDAIIQWATKFVHVQAVGFLALVCGWTIVCGLISALVTLLAWNRRHRMPERLRGVMLRKPAGLSLDGKPVTITGAMRRGLKDVARPIFWLPVAIVVAVMFVTDSPPESIVWVVIRAAGVGFVLLSLARAIDFGRIVKWLQGRGHWGPALAYGKAIDRLGNPEPTSDAKSTSLDP